MPRLGIRRPVRFYRIDELICAYTDDLSDRGAFVHTDAFLPVNGVVDLCVVLGDNRPVTVPARVAYCLPPDQARQLGRRSGIGFQFLAHAKPQLDELRQFVRGADTRAPARREGQSSSRKRVLVACAHSRLGNRLAHALSPAGVELGISVNAEELITQLGEQRWDALVLDESMGLASQLVQLAREVALPPLLLVARGHDELSRLQAYRAGVADCLPRPFTDEELRLRVLHVLQPRRRKPTPDIAGTLSRMPATSVLALLEHERRSGMLLLQGGAEEVGITLRAGGICAVDGTLDDGARHRLLSALRWSEGHCEFRTGAVVSHVDEPWPISGVLLDCARIEDERGADL